MSLANIPEAVMPDLEHFMDMFNEFDSDIDDVKPDRALEEARQALKSSTNRLKLYPGDCNRNIANPDRTYIKNPSGRSRRILEFRTENWTIWRVKKRVKLRQQDEACILFLIKRGPPPLAVTDCNSLLNARIRLAEISN